MYHVGKIIFVLSQIDHLHAAGAHPLQPRIYQVNGNDRVDPLLPGYPACHVADRSQPQDQQNFIRHWARYSIACQAVGSTSER